MDNNVIIKVQMLGFPWQTRDPFLACVHHNDTYPKANSNMGPAVSLDGRNLGNDFTLKEGWRMYHGDTVPGFPAHPHCGFETVTIVLQGLVDHADSLGASGRYGNGDVQWLTTGSGVQHSEMFPLLNQEDINPLELFQIWLNLPATQKFVKPHFLMLWADMIPRFIIKDAHGKFTEVLIVAGKIDDVYAPAPPPESYAGNTQNEVAIWNIMMEPEAEWLLPASYSEINRSIYFYEGLDLIVSNEKIEVNHCADLHADKNVLLKNGSQKSRILLLQGKPMNEPVVQYGPFVMNNRKQIQDAFENFQQTQFGGWPWPRHDQVHDRSLGRFAKSDKNH